MRGEARSGRGLGKQAADKGKRGAINRITSAPTFQGDRRRCDRRQRSIRNARDQRAGHAHAPDQAIGSGRGIGKLLGDGFGHQACQTRRDVLQMVGDGGFYSAILLG